MMSATSRQAQLSEQASFVFKGTVKKLKAATMRNVTVTNSTAIVHVDEVLQAPKLLSRYKGADITVQLSKGEKLKERQQAIFYTNGWLFGDSIAVQSTGHKEVEESSTASAAAARSVSAKTDRDLHEHLTDADIVVKGRVVSVGLPQEPASRSIKLKTIKADSTTRVSEHSPKWNEAIVDVESVEKGGRKLQKRIAVRFPRSSDVAWRRAPKLNPGQEGIFILHEATTEAPSKKRTTGAAKGRDLQSYVVLHVQDFLPTKKASQVRTMIKSKTSTKSSKKSR